jgi:hypothetical protein
VLWLSVDQWLVQCPRERSGDLARDLNQALGATSSLVVDMSDARTILRLEGEGVRELIMKGAPVDLTAPEFAKGTVRRLRFGELAAMVHMVGELRMWSTSLSSAPMRHLPGNGWSPPDPARPRSGFFTHRPRRLRSGASSRARRRGPKPALLPRPARTDISDILRD